MKRMKIRLRLSYFISRKMKDLSKHREAKINRYLGKVSIGISVYRYIGKY